MPRTRKADTAPDPPGEPLGEMEVSAAWQRLLGTVTPEMRITVAVRRLPSYLTPLVTQTETLPGIAFNTDLEQMQEEIARRYGPGRYKLYIRWTEAETGKRNVVTPEFTIGAEAGAGAPELGPVPGAPGPGAGDPDAAIEETVARLTRAANLRAKAAELGALGAFAGGEAGGGPAGLGQLAQLAELLRALQPPPVDPLQTLRTALELVRPAANPETSLGMLDKLSSIVERLGGGGPAPGGGGVRTTGWDLAIETLRQLAPILPQLIGPAVAGLLMAQQRPPAEAPAPPPAPPVAVPPQSPIPLPATADPVAVFVGGDASKAAALRTLLDLAWAEMGKGDAGEDSWSLWWDNADRYAPGLVAQLGQLGPEGAWRLWMELDRRVLSAPAAAPWVRGLVEWVIREEAQKGGAA